MHCPLCNTESKLFEYIQQKEYFQCDNCWGIFLHPKHYLNPSDEKNRYLQHNNNVEDLGYQNFVQPLVSGILRLQNAADKGLDFGSGTGPVITKLLRAHNYDIQTYDPFFDNQAERLKTSYDYIVSCEVIEHFHHPLKEFELLYALLNTAGNLYLKTHLYTNATDFKSWYYKDDPTHVFIYHEKTMEWIKHKFNFKELTITHRTILLKK